MIPDWLTLTATALAALTAGVGAGWSLKRLLKVLRTPTDSEDER